MSIHLENTFSFPNAHYAAHWMPWDDGCMANGLRICNCCGHEAITPDRVWQCANRPEKRWQLYPAPELGWAVQKRFDHPISECRGNCAFHPLHLAEYPGAPQQGHGGWLWTVDGVATNGTASFADFVDLCHEEAAATETAEQRAKREAKHQAELAELELAGEVMKREIYATDVKQRTMRGVGRGEKPKTIATPCKWVIGEFEGDKVTYTDPTTGKKYRHAECWAHEYTDPRTKKRECPHTCNRLHPGQAGWHSEWFTNRNWKPAAPAPPAAHRFVAALAPNAGRGQPVQPGQPAPKKPAAPKVASRFGTLSDSDEDLSAW
jgi:hypothetical protein